MMNARMGQNNFIHKERERDEMRYMPPCTMGN